MRVGLNKSKSVYTISNQPIQYYVCELMLALDVLCLLRTALITHLLINIFIRILNFK